MKRFLLYLALPLMNGYCQTSSEGYENFNTNQEHLVYATIWFQRSPEAKSLYFQGFNLAKERVIEYRKIDGDKPKAVIVDIDETMIDNSPFQGKMIETGKGFSSEFWQEWSQLAMAKAMPGAVDFTLFCDSLGVEIFYISNRMESELDVTIKNLQSLGFAFIKAENFLLKKEHGKKEFRRKKIAEKYDIILLLGDNLNDFSDVFEIRGDDWGVAIVEKYREAFGRRFIVFPNPLYGEWENSIYNSNLKLDKETRFKKRRDKLFSF